MNDVLARAARDFEDDALCRQDITKDIENEIAIAQCCRGILAGVVIIIRTRSQSLGRRIAHWARLVAIGE